MKTLNVLAATLFVLMFLLEWVTLGWWSWPLARFFGLHHFCTSIPDGVGASLVPAQSC